MSTVDRIKPISPDVRSAMRIEIKELIATFPNNNVHNSKLPFEGERRKHIINKIEEVQYP